MKCARLSNHVAGESLVCLLRSPGQAGKSAVYSQASPRKAAGYSVRTARYRYTQWRRDDEIVAEELYDYESGLDETTNIFPTTDAQLVAHLRSLLQK